MRLFALPHQTERSLSGIGEFTPVVPIGANTKRPPYKRPAKAFTPQPRVIDAQRVAFWRHHLGLVRILTAMRFVGKRTQSIFSLAI